jgi:hypothetical protein
LASFLTAAPYSAACQSGSRLPQWLQRSDFTFPAAFRADLCLDGLRLHRDWNDRIDNRVGKIKIVHGHAL